jgi:porin
MTGKYSFISRTIAISATTVVMVFFVMCKSVLAEPAVSESVDPFEDIPIFGGPSSVGAELKADNAKKDPYFRFDGIQRGLKPWFDTKNEMTEKHGLTYGLNYSTLYQSASASLGADTAWGGIFQIPVSWTVLGRGSKNTGTIVFKGENRHKLSADLAPQDLGIQGIGAASIVGTQFSDKDWILTNLYWQQKMFDGRFNFVAGQIDNTDVMDVYGLINPQTAFMNLSFSTNPTIGIPDQGFGSAIGLAMGKHFYLVGSLMDAAGDPSNPGDSFSNFFDNNEYFKHIELGYTSSLDRVYFDNIHIVYWESDEQTSIGESKGSGWTFSYAQFINDKVMPFVRIGISDGGGGALLEKMVSAGIGVYNGQNRDLFGFGLSWAQASEDPVGGFGSDLDPQYTAEVFYRFQFSQNFALTPDLQVIVDPVLNPNESTVYILGLRARLTI